MYVRERRDLDVGGRKICVVLAKSSSVSQCPEKKGVIRVKDYKQSLAMESDGCGGTRGTNTRLNQLLNPVILKPCSLNTNILQ